MSVGRKVVADSRRNVAETALANVGKGPDVMAEVGKEHETMAATDEKGSDNVTGPELATTWYEENEDCTYEATFPLPILKDGNSHIPKVTIRTPSVGSPK